MKISAVIPTFNVARTLPTAIAALGQVAEIVVADGGSQDGTQAAAQQAGAHVVASQKGRGGQLAVGIGAAKEDWLLLLHADTRLDPGWWDAAAAHMRDSPGKAGYFAFALDSPHPKARRLERLVAWRCRVLALPYGDQGLLIHKDTLAKVGGMRALPLMEDVDLIRRLGRRRLTAFPVRAITSAAKWERDGWTWRSARNLTCLSLWFLGVPPARIARLYG